MSVMNFAGKPEPDAESIQNLVATKLSQSGLSPADGKALGISAISGAETAILGLWRNARHPAMCVPFYNPFGAAWNFNRYRCLTDPLPGPWNDKNGVAHRFAKYTQPAKSPVHAYFPPLVDWKEMASNCSKPIIITEGELKAACATLNGFPTIGLSGVWNFMASKAGVDFLPELELISWGGRSVYICYDSDAATNPDIERALIALAARVVSRGASVSRVRLPPLLPNEKTGLDDFIVARGTKEFQILLDAAEEIRSWQHRFQIGDTGPVNNLANIITALTHAPELQEVFAYDEMGHDITVMNPPPGCNLPTPRVFTDVDVFLVQTWLQREGGLIRAGAESTRAAIMMASQARKFHPIRDWLKTLSWDGTPRLDGWLSRYLGAVDSEYTRAVGSMFLISMVARVMEPGCKVDHTLVFESRQGRHKSTTCEILSGNRWFSDQLPNIGGIDEKRLSSHLRGKWVIEIAELSALRKADIEEIKKFITRQTERYIPPYGRAAVVEPRQCVFIGTTNDSDYLRDETGNRRWWPVKVVDTDIVALRADRGQLFAEAYARHQRGEKWWPDYDFEEKVIQGEQSDRFIPDGWDADIALFLDKQLELAGTTGGRGLRKYTITTNDIATLALGIEPRFKTSEASRKIARALTRFGWEKSVLHGRFRYSPPEALIDRLQRGRLKSKSSPKVVPIKSEAKNY